MRATLAPVGRVIDVRFLMARRTLSSAVISAVLTPLLYLLGMGLGIGAVVDPGMASDLPGGGYLAFLAPGLLVATAMQITASESLWPVMVGLEWRKTYHAAVATSLAATDLVIGNLAFTLLRVTGAGVIIASAMALLGAAPPLQALAAVPVAVAVSAAFAGPITAFTATMRSGDALTSAFRFGVLPLFLFSGTFFPVDRLPDWLAPVVAISPLYHGAELARAAALGTPTAWPWPGHAAVLGVLAAAGAWLACRQVGTVLRR